MSETTIANVDGAELQRLIARLSDDHINEFVRTLTAAATTPTEGDVPAVPPIRILFDPDHVIDHNTIRQALIWLIAKVQEIPTSTTTKTAKWG
jgi:hypothetical protein